MLNLLNVPNVVTKIVSVVDQIFVLKTMFKSEKQISFKLVIENEDRKNNEEGRESCNY